MTTGHWIPHLGLLMGLGLGLALGAAWSLANESAPDGVEVTPTTQGVDMATLRQAGGGMVADLASLHQYSGRELLGYGGLCFAIGGALLLATSARSARPTSRTIQQFHHENDRRQ